MNVSLTPELERFVSDKVGTGMYQTASEVVREGLRLLKQRDEDRFESLRREVQAGLASLDAGEYEDHDDRSIRAVAESVKAGGRARSGKRR